MIAGPTTSVTRWIGIATGAAALALLLLDTEYRQNFLVGSGIAYGALIAAIALGIVLTYRGSGVVNVANGAVAMYAAYVYAILRNDGDLFLPPLPNPLMLVGSSADIPTTVSFADSLSFWPALAISLGVATLLGLALHLLVFRPLRTAPPLAKVVATVGVLVVLQATIIRRFSITSQVTPPLPYVRNTTQVHLGLVTLPQDQFFVAVLVIVFAIALWAVFRYTRYGLATRAAAENEKGAVVLGYSPDVLAGANWVLATVITALLGILVASTQSLVDPSNLVELVVPALTAALIGGFSSFGRTTIAAFVLGMQIPLIQHLTAVKGWFPATAGTPWPGFEYLVPVVGIVAVLYLAGKRLPERGALAPGRLPLSPTPPPWALRMAGPVLACLTAWAALFLLGPDYRSALNHTLVGMVICLSVVVLTGFVGQISLAQMTFAGISAFTVSKLSSEHGWPFPWPIIAGALFASLVGLALAQPALRVRGVNLAIVTLGVAVAFDHVVFLNNSVTGGYDGARVQVPAAIDVNRTGPFHVGGLTIGDGLQPNPMTAMVALVVVVGLGYLVANLRRSTTGRQLLAIRSNERAAAAAGVNVSGTKMLAFALSAFIAGIGGGVMAYQSGSITATPWTYRESLIFFAWAYLGGISSVSGAIAAGFLVEGGLLATLLHDKLGVPPEMTLVLGGTGLVMSAILNPEGIAGRLARRGRALLERVPRLASAVEAAPSTVTHMPSRDAA